MLSVACYAGDGIGVDVTNATFRMLAAVQSAYGFTVEPTFYDWAVTTVMYTAPVRRTT